MRTPFTAAVLICALAVGAWIYFQPRPASSPQRTESSEVSDDSSASISNLASSPLSRAPSSVPSITASSAAVTASIPEPATEESLAVAMHSLEQSNPARALEMARIGQKRWPNSERAAEFARTEVKCLYALGRPSEGRGAAEAMVNKYVGTPWALEVERETGAHPYVNH